MLQDHFGALDKLNTDHGVYSVYRLPKLEDEGLTNIDQLPFSIRVMLESLLRQENGREITPQDVINLAAWSPDADLRAPIPFKPARVIMQDFTGVPAIVDLAAMRSAIARLGGDPNKINPVIPVDLVVDHSLQVDFFASSDALKRNAEIEFQRNQERYEFLHWGQRAFDNFRVVPPATGIVHQVNLEYIAKVVLTKEVGANLLAFPDTLVGTDSHTTMINGLGVVGWGVGGIEAEAALLGQPIDMLTPDVIGFKLFGNLPDGVTATDLTLTVVQMLRRMGVVGKFVEFYGPGLDSMSLPDRATIANMAPEYGATMGFFPVDEETLRYLRFTGRTTEEVDRVERYCKEQGLFRKANTPAPRFTDTLELDLSSIEASMAGPKRPQDRIPLKEMKVAFRKTLRAPVSEGGFALNAETIQQSADLDINGDKIDLGHGAVVIAAITSCTNTSNPSVMLTAGLLAKEAVSRGLQVKPYVKTSLAPGSRVVTEYLEQADLLKPLAALGFNVVGYGCTTCIGNSGPLPVDVVKAITGTDLVSAAVLSGNRNFEGRIHPYSVANYLASPPLVVAYALAGTVDIDLYTEPIGVDQKGDAVFLRDIWPSPDEINAVMKQAIVPDMFRRKYADVFTGNETWNAIQSDVSSDLYSWDPDSTYIQEPPFFEGLTLEVNPIEPIKDARVLLVLGDTVTTDHISPAGAIPQDSAAGLYLTNLGVQSRDFNSFGSRRGNDRVMTRGTFGNIRLKNELVPEIEGSFTSHMPEEKVMNIFDAAQEYKAEGVPLIVIAGREYGTGSSRDWAAKGTLLLGVRAVIAESFERIHRSNLLGMGILPLEFARGESRQSLGLSGKEVYTIEGLSDDLQPMSEVSVIAKRDSGDEIRFKVNVRLDTQLEIEYYRNGGFLHSVIRNLLQD